MRFIFYLVVIYVIYKLITSLWRSRVEIKNFHYHDNRSYHDKDEEGKVHIKKDPSLREGSDKSSNSSGEYVDFEEVKD